MQLRLDAADRLVELVEERRGPVAADEAARHVLRCVGAGRARARAARRHGDRRREARLAGDRVGACGAARRRRALEDATFVVVDLETTGLRPGTAQICEIGAVRVRELEPAGEFQTLVEPRRPSGPASRR